ncbi:PHD finger protein ALFIN-LIKE 2 [Cajanus cajan]|uniref:PHD finger protein ALFIN-LIKE 2 n=1 Tax=Cajanus cajan TaxID=3821 RepID=UPI00098D8402|nr:PHD finger protein ALFIN-LIKE 2 [Cajanus cajan]
MDTRPRTVEEIFRDYKGRRTALINALTRDADELYNLCDPDKDDELCLYGYPNGKWELKLPAPNVPAELPEPVLGINFARTMERQDWFSNVSVHCTSWLLYVAYYSAYSLDQIQRQRLFSLINNLPTISEVVANWKPTTEQPSEGSASKHQENTMNEDMIIIQCGSCAGYYNPQEFWIGCDICEWWYHGKCVMMNPAKAETLKQYKCPSCNLRRGRS